MAALEIFGEIILKEERGSSEIKEKTADAEILNQEESLLGKRDPKKSGYYVCQNL
jgi:hypothetical protein